MYLYNWFNYLTRNLKWLLQFTNLNKHINSFNSISFKDIELKFDVAESHEQHMHGSEFCSNLFGKKNYW